MQWLPVRRAVYALPPVRYSDLFLPPACWGEDQGEPTHAVFSDKAHPLQIKEGNRLLHLALTYGQFPEILTCETEEEKHETLIRYRNTYFTRDLMQLSNIENLDGLLAILHLLANSLGSHLEIANFAREAGVSHFTAKKYLNALGQAQLTFQKDRDPRISETSRISLQQKRSE